MAKQKQSPNGAISNADRIRAKREEIAAETTEVFDIPGYDGDLAARYRRMEWTEIQKVGERARASKHPHKELHGQADIIAAACIELLVRDQNNPEAYERFGEVDGEPIRFDLNLCNVMGWTDIRTARETVRAMFGNDLAVSMHHQILLAWMSGVAKKIQEDGGDPNFETTPPFEPQASPSPAETTT
jgi:hypothetical protein